MTQSRLEGSVRIARVARVSGVVFLVVLLAASVPFFYALHLTHAEERRALDQRGDDVRSNVFNLLQLNHTSERNLASQLQDNPAQFQQSAQQMVNSGSTPTVAVIDPSTDPPTIVQSYGVKPQLTPDVIATLRSVNPTSPYASTGVTNANGLRYIGLVQGPPITPNGNVLYIVSSVDPNNKASTNTILQTKSDVDSALYVGSVAPQNLLLSTTPDLPLTGHIHVATLSAGINNWTVVTKERHALANSLTRAVPWIVLGCGILVAILASIAANNLVRRRDAALLLAQERSAENLAILDAAREAFISMDSDGRILRWSDQAEKLFGYSADEVIGNEVAQTIVPEYSREAHNKGFRRYLETGETHILNRRVELDAQHKDGHVFPIELSVWTPPTDGGKQIFSAIAHDITERRREAENLAAVTQRALEASQLKSEFLANMSHEIRTPMNGVIGMASLLLDSDLSPQQREQAQVVQKSAESLLNIINDILDFSKIEAGRLDIEKANFSVRTVVDEVVLLFATMAKQKGIALRANIADDVPLLAYGDGGRLRQVLLNIVGNAIKFTAEGSVEIKVEREELSEGSRLYFEVTDTGIGIAPESRERLFESFVQVDMSSTRRHEGSGLGLAISSRLVGLMDGDIGVRSEHGVGSTFWFTILVGSATQEQPKPREIPHDLALVGARKPHILVVEDNLVNQRVAVLTLERLGCTVEVVGDGASAVEIAKECDYDVIFMDCQMPGMDGYEATRRIRSTETSGRHRTIIAMTASAMQGDRDRAMASGMDDYLAKPVKMEDFVAIMTKWLDKKEGVSLSETTKPRAKVDEEAQVDLTMLNDLKKRTQPDTAVYTEIINTYLKQADDLVNEMNSAVQSNDRDGLGKAAHKLRGSSVTVGALAVARLCTDMEVVLADSHAAHLPEIVSQLDQSLSQTKKLFRQQLASAQTESAAK